MPLFPSKSSPIQLFPSNLAPRAFSLENGRGGKSHLFPAFLFAKVKALAKRSISFHIDFYCLPSTTNTTTFFSSSFSTSGSHLKEAEEKEMRRKKTIEKCRSWYRRESNKMPVEKKLNYGDLGRVKGWVKISQKSVVLDAERATSYPKSQKALGTRLLKKPSSSSIYVQFSRQEEWTINVTRKKTCIPYLLD